MTRSPLSSLLLSGLVPVAALLLFVPHAGAEQEPLPAAVRGIIQQIQERYDATSDFKADVRQDMTVASLDKTLSVHGTVFFKRPGKLRWQPNSSEGQLIIADGSTLWLYQPEEQQVLKAPLESAFRASTPISFLLGVGRIAEEFEVSQESDGKGDAVTDDPQLVWLKLIPRDHDGAIGWMRLGVDSKSADVAAAEIHDQFGNATRLRFTNLTREVGLDDSLFRFQVPKGIDVVEAPIGF